MYLLLMGSIFALSLNNTLLHNAPCRKTKDVISFTGLSTLMWIVLFLIFGKGSFTLNREIMLWGAVYAFLQVFFLIFKAKSMATGPVAITALIGNCSLILSTSAGVALFHETVKLTQIIGIVILLTAVFVCTDIKSAEKQKMTWEWKIYCVFYLVFSAMVSVVMKLSSRDITDAHRNDMMLLSAILISVSLLIVSFFCGLKDKSPSEIGKNNLWMIPVSGFLSCIFNRLNLTLLGDIPGIIFYPVFSGGVIIVSTLLSVIFLKEHLSKKQIGGIFLGVIAISLFGI